MRDYIRQIVEQYLEENIFSSAVQKKQSRGVAQSTGHAVELDMTKPNTNAKVKMAQDSKVVKGLITKGFTHAESSEGGNKVKLYFSGPRQRNTWLKKWRSLDIPEKTPEKTNESYKHGGYMSRIEKGKRRLKRMKNIKAKRIEGERRRNKTRTDTQREN